MRINNNAKLRDKVNQILDNIGDLIKDERTKKNIKMTQLAKLSGVSPSVISDLENHKRVMPNIFTLISIANALDLPEEIFINMVWCNISDRSTLEDTGKQERLKSVLSDYGLKASYIDRVINQVNYYISVENLDTDLKTINYICETELNNGTKLNDIYIEPTLLMEVRKNAERIKKAKADLNM